MRSHLNSNLECSCVRLWLVPMIGEAMADMDAFAAQVVLVLLASFNVGRQMCVRCH